MKNKQADRIDDTQGHGSVSSPGRRLQTGKYTYWPTAIRGKKKRFLLSRPIKLQVEEIEGYFVVRCEEIEMYGIIGATTELALREFAYCFESTYLTYVEEFMPNRFIRRFQQQLRAIVKEVLPR